MTQTHERRNVLLGISGSIAAYKAAELARLLVTRGYQVKVVMTKSALQFITPLTMEALTGNRVITDFWEGASVGGMDHLDISGWADVMLIAPATANVIAKLAAGLADDSLTAMALATHAPILVAPAMNVNMLQHPKTQENIATLKARGLRVIDSEEGLLACGVHGAGRLANPWEIYHEVRRATSTQDLKGKRVLISTGPTRESIDPVRFISNRSSGKMGVALAREAFRRGAQVTLVHGPVATKVPRVIECVPVMTAADMYKAIHDRAFSEKDPVDIVVMAAAVADFRVTNFSAAKLKRGRGLPELKLEFNSDILMELGNRRQGQSRPVLVGFSVEAGEEIQDLVDEARRKLQDKKVDLIVGNFAQDAFDLDTNRVWLVERGGKQSEVSTSFKSRVASKIFDSVVKLL